MKNKERYYAALKDVDFKNEFAVKKALEKAGLYSKSTVFPLASLLLELTTHCNMACKHCYNNSGIQNDLPDVMTPGKWIAFAKYLVKSGGVFECIISGGEPLLLGEPLFDLMDIFHEDGTCFLLQTNGYLLTRETAMRLKKYRYHWLQISIDGTNAEYHDSFRQRSGSWKRAVNGAQLISSNGIPLKIAHCVTPYNLGNIDEMCDLAYFVGASAITIGEICLSGRVEQNRDLLLSDDQRKILFQKVAENSSRYKGRMRIKTSNSVRLGLERHRNRPYTIASIRPNGDIRLDGMAPFVIGNILVDDFLDVWTNKIEAGWNDPRVTDFIAGFNGDDRNYRFINFAENDIHL